MNAMSHHPGIALPIPALTAGSLVGRTIKLHYQAELRAVKVGNELAEDILPSELQPSKAPVP